LHHIIIEDLADHLSPAFGREGPELLLDNPERERFQARLPDLPSMGVGVEAEIADCDLALVGNTVNSSHSRSFSSRNRPARSKHALRPLCPGKMPRKSPPLCFRESTGPDGHKHEETTSVVLEHQGNFEENRIWRPQEPDFGTLRGYCFRI
jgi:hypothetical protein